MQTKQDWEWLAAGSEYQTARAIQQLLEEEKWMEATEGLYVLIESMGKSKKLALTSQLSRLMTRVIKWKCQPERRSRSWILTVVEAREEIEEIQEEVRSLNRVFIESIWDKSFSKSVKKAEIEMGKDCELIFLSWVEVFEEEYRLEEGNDNPN